MESKEIRLGYKQTRLGWIPEEWKYRKLEKAVRKITVGIATEVRPNVVNSGIPLIRNQNIKAGKFDNSDIIFITSEFDKSNKNKRVKTDDVIIVRTGSNVGQACIVPEKYNNAQTFTTLIVRTEKDLSSDFLCRHINSYGLSEIRRLSAGAGKPNLNAGFLKDYRISFPPLPEQQKIARILSTWDTGIEQSQKLIVQLKQRKKGLMQQLLTGKTRLKGFDGEWKEYSYNSLLKEIRRPVEWDDKELYHLISVRRRSGGLFQRESLYGKEILTKNLRTTKTGDFLISKMQVVHGASGLTTEKFDDMKISGSYISARSKDEKLLNIEFFSWLSQMPYFYHQTYISSYGVHIEKMTFNYKIFLKLNTKLPAVEEQIAIVKILTTADKEITVQESFLAQLQAQKKGLMQQLLTGQKRVNV